jgi:hypothetical protein
MLTLFLGHVWFEVNGNINFQFLDHLLTSFFLIRYISFQSIDRNITDRNFFFFFLRRCMELLDLHAQRLIYTTYLQSKNLVYKHTHTHTHTYIYIYIYIYFNVRICLSLVYALNKYLLAWQVSPI